MVLKKLRHICCIIAQLQSYSCYLSTSEAHMHLIMYLIPQYFTFGNSCIAPHLNALVIEAPISV